MGERVNQIEAAKRLGVNQSTVSRWVGRHPALRGEDGLLDLEELARHRRAKVNPALRRAPAADRRPDPAPSDYSGHRARREAMLADAAELDMQARLGRTIDRRAVEAAAADAAAALRAAARQEIIGSADRIARLSDGREVETALAQLFETVLAAFSDKLAAALADDGDADMISEGRDG